MDLAWKTDGACFGPGFDPGDFYPTPTDDVGIYRAISVCHSCPVRVRCRDYALSRPEPFGVWGGLSEDQRARLHRRARREGRSVWDVLHAGAA